MGSTRHFGFESKGRDQGKDNGKGRLGRKVKTRIDSSKTWGKERREARKRQEIEKRLWLTPAFGDRLTAEVNRG